MSSVFVTEDIVVQKAPEGMFGNEQPNHSLFHIKKLGALYPGQRIFVCYKSLETGMVTKRAAFVEEVDLEHRKFKYRSDGLSTWGFMADHGLVPYPGDLWNQVAWLER